MSIRQTALYRDDVGTDWLVPTANIATFGRQLRNSKGEVQYYLSEPASLQAALKEPLPDDESLDTDEVFIKDHRQQIYGATQPDQSQVAAPQEPAPNLGNIVVSQAGGQYPGNNAAPQIYQVGGNALQPPPPQQVGLIRASIAEDRVLLPSPFRGTPDEDPAEFWRRLEVYMAYKNIAPPDQLRLVIAMLVENAQDWVEKLGGDQKDTIGHLKAAFSERFVKPPVLRFRSACEMFGKKQADNESVDAYANRLRSLAKRVDIDDATLLYAFVSGL